MRKKAPGTVSSAQPHDHLPQHLYADVAPLPIPFAEHYLQRYKTHLDDNQTLSLFLNDVQKKREKAFEDMDDVVRNLGLTTEWLTKSLAANDPLQTMPKPTFKNWQRRGIIRMDGHGKPRPSSAAAVLMIRMMDRQKEHIFPDALDPLEPDYWCIVVESPFHEPELIPVNLIDQLPASAVVWTPWSGAALQSRWRLIGENEANIGAIRFAGLRMVRGSLWWNVDFADLQRWHKPSASLYVPIPGHHERQLEDLADIVLDHVYAENIAHWIAHTKRISARVSSNRSK